MRRRSLHSINPNTSLKTEVSRALDRSLEWAASRQADGGWWVGQFESNAGIDAEWITALHIMNLSDHPIIEGLVHSLVERQRTDGSWDTHSGAPSGDISTTVEVHLALRISGMPATSNVLEKSRDWILKHGGLREVRVFTRYWLAMVGEWPWRHTPNLPPEIIWLPKWVPFNIYHFAAWARATLLPLMVLSANRPVWTCGGRAQLDELFPGGRHAFDYSLPKSGPKSVWRSIFLITDRLLNRAQDIGLLGKRKSAIRAVTRWILERQEEDGTWCGIQPAWIYSLLALSSEGYTTQDPVIQKSLKALSSPNWCWRRGESASIQVSNSPVWDTGLMLAAVQACPQSEMRDSIISKAVDWLLEMQHRSEGDWIEAAENVAPGGWSFQFSNRWYPDVDDTAVVLTSLAAHGDNPDYFAKGLPEALDRAGNWLLAMQCTNGGWAAFDKDNGRNPIVTRTPFCDFGEVLDHPTTDVTAHVIEALIKVGYGADHPALIRAIDFVKNNQESDGSWLGRWGVNHVYGTSTVLQALGGVTGEREAQWLDRGAAWLADKQNPDGGWGESCDSYVDVSLAGAGPSTKSQTAWALMGLMALSRTRDQPIIERGLRFLLDTQDQGTWHEDEYTGTGFPGWLHTAPPGSAKRPSADHELKHGFMTKYELYSHYFPMMVLARYLQMYTD